MNGDDSSFATSVKAEADAIVDAIVDGCVAGGSSSSSSGAGSAGGSSGESMNSIARLARYIEARMSARADARDAATTLEKHVGERCTAIGMLRASDARVLMELQMHGLRFGDAVDLLNHTHADVAIATRLAHAQHAYDSEYLEAHAPLHAEGDVAMLRDDATDLVRRLHRRDLVELTSFRMPPPLILEVVRPLCFLVDNRHLQPARTTSPQLLAKSLRHMSAHGLWQHAVQVLRGVPDLLERFHLFDPSAMPAEVMHELVAFVKEESFASAAEVMRRYSNAADVLAKWLQAVVKVHEAQTVEATRESAHERRERLAKFREEWMRENLLQAFS